MRKVKLLNWLSLFSIFVLVAPIPIKDQDYLLRRVHDVTLSPWLNFIGWDNSDLNALQNSEKPVAELLNLFNPDGTISKPSGEQIQLEEMQGVPFTAWQAVFEKILPQIAPEEVQKVKVTLHRGELGSDKQYELTLPDDKYLSDKKNLSIVARYVATFLNNALTSLGAKEVTIENKTIAEEVRKLYDPYYYGNGKYRQELAVRIIQNNGNEVTVKVKIPDVIRKNFNFSDNQAEQLSTEIRGFARSISEAVNSELGEKGISPDEVEKIIVPVDRHTFINLAIRPTADVVASINEKYLSKFSRPFFFGTSYFDIQAGTMQDLFAWGKPEKFIINDQIPPQGVNIFDEKPRSPPEFNPSQGTILGIDIGSTSVKFALIKDGKEVATDKIENIWDNFGGKNLDVIVNLIKAKALELIQKNSDLLGKRNFEVLDAIGISWAGPVLGDEVRGASKLTFSISDSLNVLKTVAQKLRDEFKFKSGLRDEAVVRVINDGDAGGFYAYISQSMPPDLTILALGGGLAFSKLINGQFVKGFNEWGRSVLDLRENIIQPFTAQPLTTSYLSGRGLVTIAERLGMQFPQGKDKAKYVSEYVENNINDNDPLAIQIRDRFSEYLAEAIYQLQPFYGELNEIYLGGGVLQGQFGDLIKDKVSEILSQMYHLQIGIKMLPDPQFGIAMGAAQYANMIRQNP